MGKVEERTKLGAKWAALFDEKASIEADAFTRWEDGFKGLTVEQTRRRYLTKRVFTTEEQTILDGLKAKIENIGETLKVLDQAISRDKLTPCVAARIAAEDKDIERRRRAFGLY